MNRLISSCNLLVKSSCSSSFCKLHVKSSQAKHFHLLKQYFSHHKRYTLSRTTSICGAVNRSEFSTCFFGQNVLYSSHKHVGSCLRATNITKQISAAGSSKCCGDQMLTGQCEECGSCSKKSSLKCPTIPTSSNIQLHTSDTFQSNHHRACFHTSTSNLAKPLRNLQQGISRSDTGHSLKLGQPLSHMLGGSQSSHYNLSSNTFSTAAWIVQSSPKSCQPYLKLIRFDKPIGTWLLYWPCTWSIALAAAPGNLPDVRLLALFGAGAFFMRGAGCIINDMWDKDFDGKVERTKERPLAAGDVTQFQALVFLGTQLSCALAILLQLNLYSVILGASSMILVVLYPLAKRFTHWPQMVLGLTFNYGALLGYSAVAGFVNWAVCGPLYLSCLLWTLVYDTIYAHQDKYDDMLIGVKSTALRLGENTKPVLSVFTVAMATGLVTAGQMCDMTWPYYLAVAATSARLAHQLYTVNLDVGEECANAFRGNFYLGAVMFVGIVLGNYLKKEEGEVTPVVKREVSREGELSLASAERTLEGVRKENKDIVHFISK